MLMRPAAPSNHLHGRANLKRLSRSIAVACGVGTLVLFVTAIAFWLFRLFREGQSFWGRRGAIVAAVLIFVATYAAVAIGKLPGSYLDRAGAALLGASLMVATGLLSLDDALRCCSA
jgi:hypothetical protein